VVQVRPGTALTPEALHGRVEHIVSGQATRFTSLAELWAFMVQVLTPLADPQPREGTPRCGGLENRHPDRDRPQAQGKEVLPIEP
jgi:hypothetical protein